MRFGWKQPGVNVRRAILAHAVPDGERHSEETLTTDAPVAVEAVHPVLKSRAHVRRMPLQRLPTREQRLAFVHGLDEPLPRGDDLQRPIALLKKLDVMSDRTWVTQQVTTLAQQFHDAGAGFDRRQTSQLVVVGLRLCRVRRLPSGRAPRHRLERAVGLNDGTHRQRQFPPPHHVGHIAEGANHRDARALFGIGQRMRTHRHRYAEQRRRHRGAEQRLIPGIIRVRDQRHTRRNQFRARRVDGQESATGLRKTNRVVRPGHFPVFQFRLRDGRPEVHVPQRRRFQLIRAALVEQSQERELRHPLRVTPDGGVGHRPVHRQAEMPPQPLKHDFVVSRQARTQFHKVRARNVDGMFGRRLRRYEGRVVRQRGVAAHAVVILHAAFGGQTVVVPAHRITHRTTAHALVPCDHIRMGIRKHMPHMQGSADRRRRRVDRKHLLARRLPIKPVHGVSLPTRTPFLFKTF